MESLSDSLRRTIEQRGPVDDHVDGVTVIELKRVDEKPLTIRTCQVLASVGTQISPHRRAEQRARRSYPTAAREIHVDGHHLMRRREVIELVTVVPPLGLRAFADRNSSLVARIRK